MIEFFLEECHNLVYQMPFVNKEILPRACLIFSVISKKPGLFNDCISIQTDFCKIFCVCLKMWLGGHG